MYYSSTRNNNIKISSMQAIAQGISKDSGLFVPNNFPRYDFEKFKEFSELSYSDLAKKIFEEFLTDFSENCIKECVSKAYDKSKFDFDKPVSCVNIENTKTDILELWHGPTSAFKDMALQMLPHLLTKSFSEIYPDKKAVILTATSGDTGKAALEGFKNIDNTKIMVFYPENGVSNMQKLQMKTQEGNNVYVCAVRGNFDDVQTGIKRIFTDDVCNKKLEENNMIFSSANSINWGRLLPQIVYYFYSYCNLISKGRINNADDKINIVVPTGNFGNILSAYYAMKMGLPINKFICASNSNNVLTEFINTGIYDKNREFFMTISPSMDILVSSNLERLLYDLTNKNTEKVTEWMRLLSTVGRYEVDDNIKLKLRKLFFGGFCDESETQKTIKDMFEEYNYLCDTHTAVAINVYRQYVKDTNDKDTNTVIASTASPYKFARDVLYSLGTDNKNIKNDFEVLEKLSIKTKTEISKPIALLKNKKTIFNNNCDIEKIKETVLKNLNI